MEQILISLILNASLFGIDPLLIRSIIEVESNYNINAIGSVGEVGLMQLHPKFHKSPSFDVDNNIYLGTKMLAKYKKACYSKYGDAWFICYNVGPNKLIRYPTKFKYYIKVMNVYEKLSKGRRYITRH